YDQYCFLYTTSIGEIKIKNTTNRLKVIDFYRLTLLAKAQFEQWKHTNSKVNIFNAGGTLHFFYMTEQCDIWTFLELPSVTITMFMNDLMSIDIYLDNFLSIKELYEKIKREPKPRPPLPKKNLPLRLFIPD
ncbi:hypothetical protein CLU79DRAFT_693620, partial [Phycomyces nitens]